MAVRPFILALMLMLALEFTNAQQTIDRVKFFQDTSVINSTLLLNFKKLMSKKDQPGLLFPATFTCKMGDGQVINDPIQVEVRGHFRRGYCYMPPLKLIFKNHADAAFYHLKSLKLVSACKPNSYGEQNLLKEYLIYKIYNLITDKSFRVRLLNLRYQDSSGVKKPINEHAFLIEDIKEVAKRNQCIDYGNKFFATERTDRMQTTIVSVFEYMIGNTDWAIPANHNIKLLRSIPDSLSRPYVIPYDFDFSGFVNTNYSAPDERLEIESVRERKYRGFPRTMEELNQVLDIFKKQKTNIYAIVNNFSLLTKASKEDITGYLDEFYKTIDNSRDVENVFITNARTR